MNNGTAVHRLLRTESRPESGAVDLWIVDLGGPANADDAPLLDARERERAGHFVIERDRRRFIHAHAALRRILSRYLGRAPSALQFSSQQPNGKPALGVPGEAPLPIEAALHWNLSHSEDLAIVGVASSQVGVDVEFLREPGDIVAIAQRHFSDAEVAALQRRRGGERAFTFLCGWTRKEACLKAAGIGIRVDTRLLDAGVDPGPREVRLQWEGRDYRMLVQSIACHREALVAVALETTAAPHEVTVRVHEETRPPAA